MEELTLLKVVKKYGNSKIIRLSNDDLKIINVKEGDPIKIKISRVE